MAARYGWSHCSALLEFDPSLCESNQFLLQPPLLLVVLSEVGSYPPSAVAGRIVDHS